MMALPQIVPHVLAAIPYRYGDGKAKPVPSKR
jgi:hypothetical protein